MVAWRSWTLTGSDGLEAEVVGRAVDGPALDPAAGHPDGEPVVVVVAAELGGPLAVQLDGGGPAEFAAPDDERVVEHPQRCLRSVSSAAIGCVDLGGELAVVLLDLGVVGPRAAPRRARAGRNGRRARGASGR